MFKVGRSGGCVFTIQSDFQIQIFVNTFLPKNICQCLFKFYLSVCFVSRGSITVYQLKCIETLISFCLTISNYIVTENETKCVFSVLITSSLQNTVHRRLRLQSLSNKMLNIFTQNA